MKYLVIEIQTTAGGSVAQIVTIHDTKAEAEQKYHQVLSFAAVSELAYHSVVILNAKGEWEKGETYDHTLTGS